MQSKYGLNRYHQRKFLAYRMVVRSVHLTPQMERLKEHLQTTVNKVSQVVLHKLSR